MELQSTVPVYNKGNVTYVHGGVEVKPGRIYKMRAEDARALWKLFPGEIVVGDPAPEPLLLERELRQLQEQIEMLRKEMEVLAEHKIMCHERQQMDAIDLSGKLGRAGHKVRKKGHKPKQKTSVSNLMRKLK